MWGEHPVRGNSTWEPCRVFSGLGSLPLPHFPGRSALPLEGLLLLGGTLRICFRWGSRHGSLQSTATWWGQDL